LLITGGVIAGLVVIVLIFAIKPILRMLGCCQKKRKQEE
jgi:hypothetical protein